MLVVSSACADSEMWTVLSLPRRSVLVASWRHQVRPGSYTELSVSNGANQDLATRLDFVNLREC